MTILSILQWLQAHSVAFVGGMFLVLLTSVYWPGRKQRFERDAMIPFRDDK